MPKMVIRLVKRATVFVLVLAGLWGVYEGYRWLWQNTGWTRPFAANDLTMPQIGRAHV